jgi:hypothetical protein
VRKLSLLLVALCALALTAASGSNAGPAEVPCGLPTVDGTLWVDYGWPTLENIFGRKGVVVGASTGGWPAHMRALGASTIRWDMHLRNRVGIPNAPMDPSTIVDRANRLFDAAVVDSGCSTPLIAENELFGADLVTPWSDTNTVYRSNVMTFVKQLADRGAHPILLLPKPPYTGSDDARNWWRQVAQYSDLVREVYPSAKSIYALGPILGNRELRMEMRNALVDFTSIGVPTSKLGVMLGFQTTIGYGGRGGLKPASAWFRVAKWQALSAKAVAKETHLASVWSWGWSDWAAAEKDPDKAGAACVWLWARTASLCNGPAVAGPDFVKSLTEGQILLPGSAQCIVGKQTIGYSAIHALQRLTGDQDVAYSALFERLVESHFARVSRSDVLAAERAVIAEHFDGNAAAYRAALASAGANVTIARAVLADVLRRVRIERTLGGGSPSASSVSTFYESYPETLVRPVAAKPAPSWLGWRSSGWALQAVAPSSVFSLEAGRPSVVRSVEGTFKVRASGEPRQLGTLPLSVVAPSIRSVLRLFAQRAAFDKWTTAQQTGALRSTICRRDDLPVAGSVDLTDYLPFLSTSG